MDKHVVTVSREWKGLLIRTDVTDTSVGVSMSLPEFIEALTLQAGNPAVLLTQNQLRKRLMDAAAEVVRKMKAETNKVM